MAEIRERSVLKSTIKTFDKGSIGIGRIRNVAAEVKSAENRLEEYGRSSDHGSNQDGSRLMDKPVKALRFSERAAGLIKSRIAYKSRTGSVKSGERSVAGINPVEMKAYQEAGRKAYIKKRSIKQTALNIRNTAKSMLSKGSKAVRLTAPGSKAVLTAFAAVGGAGIACIAIVIIVTASAVVFEMAGYDEDALTSDMNIEQFMETAFGDGSEDIVLTAEKELGNKGGKKFWKWYGFDSRVEWCACFVFWCADKSGLIQQGQIPKFADCRVGMNWFKEKNRWMRRGVTPKPGWIIFFDWGNDGSIDHVGIVERSDGNTVHTIEGNSRNMVRRKSYSIKSKIIEGYGVVSADEDKKEDKKEKK